MKTESEDIILRARSVNMPDGIFKVVVYNRHCKMMGRTMIDLYEVFPNESNEVIGTWVEKAKQLLKSNFDIGDAYFSIEYARIKLDDNAYEEAKKKYNNKVSSFKSDNLGFSEDTYEHAISLGMIAAR